MQIDKNDVNLIKEVLIMSKDKTTDELQEYNEILEFVKSRLLIEKSLTSKSDSVAIDETRAKRIRLYIKKCKNIKQLKSIYCDSFEDDKDEIIKNPLLFTKAMKKLKKMEANKGHTLINDVNNNNKYDFVSDNGYAKNCSNLIGAFCKTNFQVFDIKSIFIKTKFNAELFNKIKEMHKKEILSIEITEEGAIIHYLVKKVTNEKENILKSEDKPDKDFEYTIQQLLSAQTRKK